MQPETAEGLVGQYQKAIELGFVDPEKVPLEQFRQTTQSKTVNEINMTPGDGLPGLGTLTPDYSYVYDKKGNIVKDKDGIPKVRLIPDSATAKKLLKEDLEKQQKEDIKTITDVESATVVKDATSGILNILDSDDGMPAVGIKSRPFAMFESTNAGKVRSYTDALKSKVAVGTIMLMKAASATGATGFGQLNLAELRLLLSDIGALDPDNTDAEIFRGTVKRIDQRYNRIIKDIKKNLSAEKIEELGLTQYMEELSSSETKKDPLGIRDDD